MTETNEKCFGHLGESNLEKFLLPQKKKKILLWSLGGIGTVLAGFVLLWVFHYAPLLELGRKSGRYIGLQANCDALKKNPNDPNALRGMASEFIRRRGFPQAVAYLEKAVAVEPDNSNNKYELGVELLHAGRSNRALKIFQELAATDCFEQKYAQHFVEAIKRNPNLWRYKPPAQPAVR